MQSFLRRFLLFLLPVAAVLYPLDRFFSFRLSRINFSPWEQEVWQDLYHSKAACALAVYGSSRAWVHFDAPFLEAHLKQRVYNFGMDGHNFWFQYLRHLELLKHNPKPKTILVSLDESSLTSPVRNVVSEHFLPYMLWNRDMAAFLEPSASSKSDCLVPLLRFMGKNQAIGRCLSGNLPTLAERHRTKGFKSMDLVWTDDLDQARKKHKNYRITVNGKVVGLFIHFLQTCRTAGIQVVLVYPPEQIEGQQFVRNHQDVMQLYYFLAEKYSVPFLDYSRDKICFDKQYFYNANHMNTKGVSYFNQKLLRDLIPLLIAPDIE